MFVSTQDSASGIFLQDMQKGLEGEKEEYRISVKLLRTDWNKLGTISISRSRLNKDKHSSLFISSMSDE